MSTKELYTKIYSAIRLRNRRLNDPTQFTRNEAYKAYYAVVNSMDIDLTIKANTSMWMKAHKQTGWIYINWSTELNDFKHYRVYQKKGYAINKIRNLYPKRK